MDDHPSEHAWRRATEGTNRADDADAHETFKVGWNSALRYLMDRQGAGDKELRQPAPPLLAFIGGTIIVAAVLAIDLSVWAGKADNLRWNIIVPAVSGSVAVLAWDVRRFHRSSAARARAMLEKWGRLP